MVRNLVNLIEKLDLRPGGFTRIFIKIMFLLIKFDKTRHLPTLGLLKFYIFRDNNSIRIVQGIARTIMFKSSSQKFNLLDVSMGGGKNNIEIYDRIKRL